MLTFGSLLVANRGEIATRIFRTARRLGLRTIAVFSDADADALHVRAADEAVRIGPAIAAQSYLHQGAILEAARSTGAEAIHPGYGFLSENPDFAEAVQKAGLIWVGPRAATIRSMGLKDEAKRLARAAGVAVVPGFFGTEQSADILRTEAAKIGFPVLIKALAGGGGRGIREVHEAATFDAALASAQREAASSFGDDRVLVEKLIARPRHIEVQILGDSHGQIVHLFERDCSLQRRRQKVLEEVPAPGMTPDIRRAMTEAALKVARQVNYENAGTVEFVVDGSGPLRANGFYFLEMNTRLQVEHPVTEMVTGLDLVEWQLRVAAGEKLPWKQDDIVLRGHAIEARLCAEDPAEGFRPSVGRIERMDLPTNIRVDRGFEARDNVPSDYDSMIAKLIAFSPEGRLAAIAQLSGALDELAISGIRTNAGFLRRCLAHADFQSGAVHTGLIQDHLEALTSRGQARQAAARALARFQQQRRSPDPFGARNGFRLNRAVEQKWRFEDELGLIEVDLGADERDVDADAKINGAMPRIESGLHTDVYWQGESFRFSPPGALTDLDHSLAGDLVKAPMPGKVAAVHVKIGAQVKKGDVLVVFEAMKMELALASPRDGEVEECNAVAGEQRPEGDILVRLKERPE